MARVTQEHIDARRSAILDAAGRVFVRRGVGAATIQEIADEAGLSAGAIYRYYPGKTELLEAFYVHCITEGPVALIDQATGLADDAIGSLQAAAFLVREKWAGNEEEIAAEIETILAAARQPNTIGRLVRQARCKVYDAIEQIIREGQQRNEIDPAFDARALAISLHAFVYGIAIMSLEHDEPEIDSMYETLGAIASRLAPR